MYDCGNLMPYQRELDTAGINFDMTAYAGCTAMELRSITDSLINSEGDNYGV